MNLYSEGAQVGFLIGMYFMASAIVALTLVYFSRPKPKNQNTRTKLEPSGQTAHAKEQDRPVTEDRPQGEILNPPLKPEAVDKLPEQLEKKEEPSMNVGHAAPGKKDTVGQSGSKPKEDNIKKTPLITVTNEPKAPVESITPVVSVQEKAPQEPAKAVDAKEAKQEASATPATPPSQAVNENPGKSGNDGKPKPASSSDDFNDLFTEDTEESEASRLAKELNDVETDDILQAGQDLISVFKRNKGA